VNSLQENNKAVLIAGPTAGGKPALALALLWKARS
jgi:tRNA A37 N6-isopentenylltransferase MiaA